MSALASPQSHVSVSHVSRVTAVYRSDYFRVYLVFSVLVVVYALMIEYLSPILDSSLKFLLFVPLL
jgi:hypothetical protein